MNLGIIGLIFAVALLGVVACIRNRLRIGIGLLAFAILATAFYWQEGSRSRRRFDEIQNGDAEKKVLDAMGSPYRVTDGTISIHGGKKSASAAISDCHREIWYMATLTPEQWAICLNQSGLVVGKSHYHSY